MKKFDGMKKIDLYEIAIKILGLYLIVIIINQLRDVLVQLTVWFQQKNNPEILGYFDQTPSIIVMIFGLLALITLSAFLIFKTKPIAKLISKKEDFEEDLKIFSDRKVIYEICLVLLGLISVVLTLPDFIFKLKNQISLVQSNILPKNYDTSFLITSGIKIGIGIIAIIYSKEIADFLTKRNSKREEIDKK